MKTWGIASLVVVTCLLTVSSVLARTWYIKPNGTGDVPTIQAGADSASHGDTLLCAPGTYSWNNQGTGNGFGMIHILRGSADMVIRSEYGPAVTILDGQWQGRILFFQGETKLTVEGFTFKRGEASSTGYYNGGAFGAHLSSPIVRDCWFINNHAQNQGGAYWYGGVGAPEISDCRFENNSAQLGGAVFLINSPGPGLVANSVFLNNTSASRGGALFLYNFKVAVEGCLFAKNAGSHGGAINIESSYPSSVNMCTIAKNDAAVGAGLHVTGGANLTVTNTIVAFCTGGQATEVGASTTVSYSCSDIFGNDGGDWSGMIAPQLGLDGNISADPLFCTGEYSLQGNSPCATGNHPDGVMCGGIGLYPIGCGSVAVEHKSWGAIKSMYANSP